MSGTWRLRGYSIERLLGRGASSEVWAARATSSGDPVALKRLVLRAADQQARALGEAALLTVLDHPNLVRLHAVRAEESSLVLVLDLVEGGSLAELITARGRLTAGEVVTALAPVAAALAHLHARGVVHGDVSAANILFTPGGTPLLADLGVARLTGDDADAESTPAYVDPAVARGGVPAPASDVFMIAAVALHALTGRPLWAGSDVPQVLARARDGDLGDVAERLAQAGVGRTMAAVLRRALVESPAQRCTAAEFALDLRGSATPIAVELAAGRAPSPGLTTVTATGEGALSTSPRVGRQPPTVMVARPRPVIAHPRPSRLGRPWRASGRRTWAIAAFTAAVLLAGGGWALRAGSPAVHPAPGRSGVPDTAALARTLTGLDAIRARAFASRDAALLARVYRPGPLLSTDTDLLHHVIPSGCRLVGVSTRYVIVSSRVGAEGTTVTARASLPAARLLCRGASERRTATAGPITLRITLVHGASGWRIADQRSV